MTFYVCYAGLDNRKPKVFVTEDMEEVDKLPNEYSMMEVQLDKDLKDLHTQLCLMIYNTGFEREASRFENTESRCRLTFDALSKYVLKTRDRKKPWEEAAANKNDKPSKPQKPGIGKFVEDLIDAEKTNAEIHEAVKVEFPDSKLAKDGKNISWYRTQLKKRRAKDEQTNGV